MSCIDAASDGFEKSVSEAIVTGLAAEPSATKQVTRAVNESATKAWRNLRNVLSGSNGFIGI